MYNTLILERYKMRTGALFLVPKTLDIVHAYANVVRRHPTSSSLSSMSVIPSSTSELQLKFGQLEPYTYFVCQTSASCYFIEQKASHILAGVSKLSTALTHELLRKRNKYDLTSAQKLL
uniref:Uncharacterized protein n=1 Tax=Ixodes ricinus TaxID=34613 RepID=A0A6B0UM71_IXORI